MSKTMDYSSESIKYAGSKLKLLPEIMRLVEKTDSRKILDGFSGSTRVSQVLARNGYQVISNDKAVWSGIIGNCYLNGGDPQKYIELIEHLNNLHPIDGWFTKYYGGDKNNNGSVAKFPWQKHNTMKLDAIRTEIDNLNLSNIEKDVALTSLMLALDRVDNTMGHFSSYLREWSNRSNNILKMEIPKIVQSIYIHKISTGDIFDALNEEVDLAYFDPPYGSNNEKMPSSRVRYDSYYHVYKTICLNDNPELFGKANRRIDSSDKISSSVFEDFRLNQDGKLLAHEAVENLLAKTKAKNIILSYSSGGKLTFDELCLLLKNNGEIVDILHIKTTRKM